MPRTAGFDVYYSPAADADLDDILSGFADAETAAETFRLIDEAVGALQAHPEIGRPARAGLRELVISIGKTGYVALYQFNPIARRVVVLALRHQRQLNYRER